MVGHGSAMTLGVGRLTTMDVGSMGHSDGDGAQVLYMPGIIGARRWWDSSDLAAVAALDLDSAM